MPSSQQQRSPQRPEPQPLRLPSALLLASISAVLIAVPTLWEVLWPCTWIALLPLLLALRNASLGRAFVLGWWTETLAIWIGFHWLIGTMVHFGFIPLPLSLLFLAIMGVGNGIRLGLFAAWLRLTTGQPTWWSRLWLPACTYVAVDYLFPRVFPWYLGFTQFPVKPIIQIADLTGIHGITFLLLLTSTVGSMFFPHPSQPSPTTRRAMAAVVAALLLLSLGYAAWRMPQITRAMQQATSLRLALIQPNIGIDEKDNRSSNREHLHTQIDMSRTTLAEQPDLIIWPESMYPYALPTQTQHLALPTIQQTHSAHWLIGALTYTRDQANQRHIFNSALLVAPDRRIIARYDKQVLLAFGEYIPLQRYLPFLRHISPTIGNLTPGTGSLLTLPNGVSIGSLICYEDILPRLARRAIRQGAQLLVNLTNDAWFGQTRAPYQHRTLAAFRAVEHRVYLVRVTNTGLTSIIDPLGHEQGALPIYQRRTRIHNVQPLRLGTLYTRFGDWFAQLCSSAAILLPLLQWRRKNGGLRRKGKRVEAVRKR